MSILRKKKAAIALGGKGRRAPNERPREGYFFSPTVIVDLPVPCRTNHEEIFGPVVTIPHSTSEEEVIDFANDSDYGLASSCGPKALAVRIVSPNKFSPAQYG